MIPALLGLIPLVKYVPDLVKLIGKVLGGKTKEDIEEGKDFTTSVTSALESGDISHDTELQIFSLIQAYRDELSEVNKELTEALLEAGVREVELSMRKLEMTSEDPWTRRWRPFWGYSSAVTFFLQICILGAALLMKIGTVADLAAYSTAIALLWGVPASILTVSAYHRGKMQRIAAGEVSESKPNVFTRIMTRISGDDTKSS
jgi:hypothetical protein